MAFLALAQTSFYFFSQVIRHKLSRTGTHHLRLCVSVSKTVLIEISILGESTHINVLHFYGFTIMFLKQ